METIYRKVKVADRLPEQETPVIIIYESGEAFRATVDYSGYWWHYDGCAYCDEPDYWLEEIELPTEEQVEVVFDFHKDDGQISKLLMQHFKNGANYILNRIKN